MVTWFSGPRIRRERKNVALDRLAGVHPNGRIGRPEEIADAVVWLLVPGNARVLTDKVSLGRKSTIRRSARSLQEF